MFYTLIKSMKTTLFHTSGIARSGVCFIAALSLGVGSTLADHSVTVNLSGQRIINGLKLYLDSGGVRLDPAKSYTYAVKATCHCTSKSTMLTEVAPSPISLNTLLNTFKPNSAGFLSGTYANLSGKPAFTAIDKIYKAPVVTKKGIGSFSATFVAGVYSGPPYVGPPSNASRLGQVYFRIYNISIVAPLAGLPGTLTFDPGSKLVITAVP